MKKINIKIYDEVVNHFPQGSETHNENVEEIEINIDDYEVNIVDFYACVLTYLKEHHR
jgi:hypothetical protein